jgi:hypothetical protein
LSLGWQYHEVSIDIPKILGGRTISDDSKKGRSLIYRVLIISNIIVAVVFTVALIPINLDMSVKQIEPPYYL